jgi:ankyrin repeat protein
LEKDVLFDDKSNKNGQKPIHWACMKGRIEIVSLMRNLKNLKS